MPSIARERRPWHSTGRFERRSGGVSLKIPDKTKIGGIWYETKYDEHLAAERDRFGEMSPTQCYIRLDAGLNPQKQCESYFHEIVEAIDGHCQLDLEHPKIQTLGFMLYQVFADNKLLRE